MAVRTRVHGWTNTADRSTPARVGHAAALGVCAAAVATVASAAPLLFDWIYRDNRYLTSGWRGNDIVTLAVGVPLLLATTVLAARGSTRARLVWLGALDYMLYNFLFYLFGTNLNALFLAYAAVVGLSLLALVLGIAGTDASGLAGARSHRGVAIALIVVAAGLAAVEIGQVLGPATGGVLPEVVQRTGANTHVVAALDLTLVIPFLVLAALWLWTGHPWGRVIGIVLATKGVVYMAALVGTTLSTANAGYDVTSEIPIWAGILVTFGVIGWQLLRDIPQERPGLDARPAA